ncbi:MAG: peptidoglycan DD-metalloendopeptidase family protein, partial [Leptolyngbyaceae bacterium]|nr:peptidoglycan DD-metalloendopeptidase family protein [Leptolyngbyaceae bacterium]
GRSPLLGLVLMGVLSLVLWGAIAPPTQGQSGDIQQLQRQQQQVEQERRTLQQQRSQIENQENQAEDALRGLEGTIQSTAQDIAENEEKLAAANTQLKQLQDELAAAEQRFQDRQFATIGRLRFLQRQQSSEGWAVLLQSSDINEFLDRRHHLKRLYEADRQILTDLKTEADDLEQRRRTVERQKNEIALLTQELLARKTEYEAQAQEQEKLVSRLKEDRRALEAAEARLAADSENLSILIQQRLATAEGIVRGTGRFIFPANGRISSGFGNRVHPILGYRRFHAGIDFAASYGTTIRAADSGRVIFSGWYGGYGRAVVINHGNGITTLYAHASRLFVAEGAVVQQGQAIAAVGSSGLSTGPHLHFEVRRNGSPINPTDFL